MTDDAERLLDLLGREMGEEERLILCGFRGDPNRVGPTAWRPRPWRPGRSIPFDPPDNAYVAVASFGKAQDGSFRRRVDTFRGGRALMVDDVGTKVPRATVERLPPTAIVETSPGNEQWWYVLEQPERDVSHFDAVIRAFISGSLLGADPGMSGVNRVGRLPGFENGKPKYGGWRCRLREFEPARLFTIAGLLSEFGLALHGQRYANGPAPPPISKADRIRAFVFLRAELLAAGMLKRDGEPDPSGWTEMRCPWIDNHTDRADTGAAIREPADENGWYGAFRCHHGHCAELGWGDLTDWMNEGHAESIERANMNDSGVLTHVE